MRKLFEIDENEKRRILEMHENATKNLYLNEQPTPSTTPPPSQPENATGGEIEGTKTIDKVKDAASLNKFYDWGGEGITNGVINKTPNMALRVGFNNIKTAEELQANPDARAAIDKVYEDFKTIAKTYTLAELCGNPTVKAGIDRNSLAKATNRAGDLGWCGTKTPTGPSKSDIKQKVNNPAQFQADRTKA
jgi:hypothetical protein